MFYSYSSVSQGRLLIAIIARESALKFEQDSPMEGALS
jgi:hypothetical protein